MLQYPARHIKRFNTSMYRGIFVRYTTIFDMPDDVVSAMIAKKKKKFRPTDPTRHDPVTRTTELFFLA